MIHSSVVHLLYTMFKALFFLCVIFAVSLVTAEIEENSARVLLYKSTSSDVVVEGRDFLVTYQIINTGNAAASKIEVFDRYDPQSFESSNNVNGDGNVEFELEELAPGAHAVFNVTLKPKLFGYYESTRATIKYGAGAVEIEGVEAEYRSGYSTSLGVIKIESTAEFERRTSYHFREWGVFAALYSIPMVIPFFLWRATRSITAKIAKSKTN